MSVRARLVETLRERLVAALGAAVAAGELPSVAGPEPVVEMPRESGHGELASPYAMQLARALRVPPRAVAERLAAHLGGLPPGVRVEVANPGFLNFHLDDAWLAQALAEVLERGSAYGDSDVGGGRRVLIEFVSANPTGPLNVVNARAAAVGDSLARLLAAVGYRVEREFYVNDAGGQVGNLARSLEVRLRQRRGEQIQLPPDGYPGHYLVEMAEEYERLHGDAVLELPEEERLALLRDFAVERIRAQQEASCERFGVHFDRFFSERRLHETGAVDKVVKLLGERGHTYQKDDATWLAAREFGDDKDRVLVKSDGTYTYVVPDIAYHLDKLGRGHDLLIDLLGPDHHGYVARMRAALEALGYPPEVLEVHLIQQVRLLRAGRAVSMSKRAGEFVTMDQLVAEVGCDAARFFFLQRSPESPLDFDLDLAKLETSENPVFYVQYAHARIRSLFRQAGESWPEGADLTLLNQPEERELMRQLSRFPEEVLAAARERAPHRVARYCLELAGLFHSFYNRHRVLGSAPPTAAARLSLARAVGAVLARGLDLLGVTAPERM